MEDVVTVIVDLEPPCARNQHRGSAAFHQSGSVELHAATEGIAVVDCDLLAGIVSREEHTPGANG